MIPTSPNVWMLHHLLRHGLNPIPCHFGVLLDTGYHCTCGKGPTPPIPANLEPAPSAAKANTQL